MRIHPVEKVVALAAILSCAAALIFAFTVRAPAVHWAADKYAVEDHAAQLERQFFQNAGMLPVYEKDGNGVEYKSGEFGVSCCGIADAYEADDFDTDAAGNLYAILTCNEPRHCEHVDGKVERPPGSRHLVPKEKVLVPGKPLNNTGHGWVFISTNNSIGVICWSAPAGL